MEPILISSLKTYVQNAILNNQDKLNPVRDAYIDETEIGELLRFFGAKDISELQETGLDTFTKTGETSEGNQPKDADTQITELQQEAEEFGEAIQLMTNSNEISKVSGSAAEELITNALAEMYLASAESPYADTYNGLMQQKEELEAKGEDTSAVENQIDELTDLVKDYIRNNQDVVVRNLAKSGAIKEFHYGKDNSKTGYIIQTIRLKGNNGIQDRDTVAQTDDDGDDTTNTKQKNQFDGGIIYVAKIGTPDVVVNFMADCASDNTDITFSAEHHHVTKNDISVDIMGTGKVTVKPGDTEGTFGASLDLSKDKFSGGAFALCNFESVAGEETDKNFHIEGNFAYNGNNNKTRVAVGAQFNDYINYSYLKAKYYGNKTIEDKNLTLTGSVMTEAGRIGFNKNKTDEAIPAVYNFDAKLRGGIAFATEDFKASAFGNLSYGLLLDPTAETKEDKYVHSVSGSVIGDISYKKVGMTAMVAFMNNPGVIMDSDNPQSKCTVSSNITVKYKDIMPGVSPFISYSVNNSLEGLQHGIGGGIGLTF